MKVGKYQIDLTEEEAEKAVRGLQTIPEAFCKGYQTGKNRMLKAGMTRGQNSMPFIKAGRRKMIDKDQYFSVSKTEEGIQPEDRCYFYYMQMVDKWKANPVWATAHEIYKNLGDMKRSSSSLDDKVAVSLAWQIFFQLHLMFGGLPDDL